MQKALHEVCHLTCHGTANKLKNDYLFWFRFIFFQKLENITVEKLRWKKYEDDYKSAEVNLSSFRESLQKEILVPIGSKALMPGHLYHTNEILVGMYSGLLTKCSSYKAIELCNHRLRKAKEHIHALDAEHKMYK